VERIDRQIVHCLRHDGRASFRRIADVLGVSEQTVARRYRALRSRGALRVQALPDARAAGDRTWFVRMRCRPDSTDALADAVAARADVSWVSITSGGSEIVCVTRTDPQLADGPVLHRLPRTNQMMGFNAFAVLHAHAGSGSRWLDSDDPLTADQLAALRAGAPPNGTGDGARPAIRAEDGPLLAELAQDGRAGVVALARATGWPQSRVSARLDELLSARAVRVELDLAPPQFGFHAVAYLWLTVAPGELEATGAALAGRPGTTFAAAVTGTANLLVAVTCRDADALYAYVTTEVGVLPAVRQVEVVPVLHRLKQAGARVQDGRLVLR
jgi:DNA-binding Lrp family transcriptional regulator